MAVLKYKNPNYTEGGTEEQYLTLNTGGGGGIEDAPVDGKLYVRLDGGWNELAVELNYETVNVSVVSDDSSEITVDVTIDGKTKSITSGSSVMWEIKYDTEYTVTPGQLEGYAAPDVTNYTAWLKIRNIELTYAKTGPFVTMIRIYQDVADPYSRVERIIDEGGIEAIRANSHRYLGQYDTENEIMRLKQLDDNNSEKYLDGSIAYLTGEDGECYMKLPLFWWKMRQYEGNTYDFYVAYGANPGDEWVEWDGKECIGVFESDRSLNSRSNNLAIADKILTIKNTLSNNFDTSKFSLVKYKHRNIMAMLFYTYYNNTNPRLTCGKGFLDYNSSTYARNYKLTGSSKNLGMIDTVYNESYEAGSNNYSDCVNFWGLENWWGNRMEWSGEEGSTFDNSGSIRYTDVTNTVQSAYYSYSSIYTLYYPYRLRFAENNITTLPINGANSDATSSTYYCDYFRIPMASNSDEATRYMTFAILGTSGGTVGLTGFLMTDATTSTDASTRLCYHGEYVIES